MEIINWQVINDIEFIWVFQIWETISSFDTEIKTKYSYKSDLWVIFNFNTIWNFCWERNQIYWNLMLNSNPNNIPEISTIEYQSPLKNWWFYQNKRFDKQEINFDLEIVSNNIENLEKEIQLMKQVFSSSGKIFKKYNKHFCYLDVILKEFSVWVLKNSGTEIKITFESLAPFWISDSKASKIFENQTTKIDTTIMINDSDYSPEYTTIIQVWNITWNINKFSFSLNWFEVEINENIRSWSIIVFDWKELKVTLDWFEVLYFWEFSEIPVWKPCQIKINYSGGNILNYNLYILYDKIIL